MRVTRRVEETTMELLLHEGLLDKNGAKQATARAQDLGETPPEAAINLGLVSEKDVTGALCRHLSLPYLDATRYFVKREVFESLPLDLCETHHFVPMDKIGDLLIIAIAEVLPRRVIEKIETASGLKSRLYVSTLSSVTVAIRSLKEQLQLNKKKA